MSKLVLECLYIKEERMLNHTPCWGKGCSSDVAHASDGLRCLLMAAPYLGLIMASYATFQTNHTSKAGIWRRCLMKVSYNCLIRLSLEEEVVKTKRMAVSEK